MKVRNFTLSVIASTLILATNTAYSAALSNAETSTTGLGRAYAGEAAIADNASVVATNPALMSYFKQAQLSVGGVYVNSSVDVDGTVTSTVNKADPTDPANKDMVITGTATHNNVMADQFIPNIYFVAPINDKLAIGGGINSNFGLKTQYDASYDSGLSGGTTEFKTTNFNLSASYKANEKLSMGVGVNAVLASLEFTRHSGIIGTTGTTLDQTTYTVEQQMQMLTSNGWLLYLIGSLPKLGYDKETVIMHLKDQNAWGLGWNAGLSYQLNENNRFGLAYHSKVDIEFKDNELLTNLRETIGRGGLTLRLPNYWEFSGFHQVSQKLALHYSYKYTYWSRLKDLYASFENGNTAFNIGTQYRNSYRVALGATYDLNDKFTFRAGIAHDKAASPEEYALASMPDTDRTWYSVGLTYNFSPDLSLDLGYSHISGKKIQFKDQQTLFATAIKIDSDFSVKSSYNLYGLNLNYKF